MVTLVPYDIPLGGHCGHLLYNNANQPHNNLLRVVFRHVRVNFIIYMKDYFTIQTK